MESSTPIGGAQPNHDHHGLPEARLQAFEIQGGDDPYLSKHGYVPPQRPDKAVAISICFRRSAGSAELASATIQRAQTRPDQHHAGDARQRRGAACWAATDAAPGRQATPTGPTPRSAPRKQGMRRFREHQRRSRSSSEKPMVLSMANSAKRSRTDWAMPLAVRNSTMNMPASAMSRSTVAISTPELRDVERRFFGDGLGRRGASWRSVLSICCGDVGGAAGVGGLHLQIHYLALLRQRPGFVEIVEIAQDIAVGHVGACRATMARTLKVQVVLPSVFFDLGRDHGQRVAGLQMPLVGLPAADQHAVAFIVRACPIGPCVSGQSVITLRALSTIHRHKDAVLGIAW